MEFPNLSQMALNILSIPPLSRDRERSISKLSNALKPHYLQMRPNIIAALQGGNINASDAPPASMERKISEP